MRKTGHLSIIESDVKQIVSANVNQHSVYSNFSFIHRLYIIQCNAMFWLEVHNAHIL